MNEFAPRPPEAPPRWIALKWMVLTGYVGTVAALLAVPDRVTPWFWNALVPVLPALFLVNVELWRNVCPLATLNTLPADDRASRVLPKRTARLASAIGILVLLALLPLRRAVLNPSGIATAALLALAGLMAFASGLRFRSKAGFCNSVCPILPVERLYGLRPMRRVTNARCTPCRACTRAGCIDLGTERAVLQIVGPGRTPGRWMVSPFGAFALAFPGVVAGFYLGAGDSGTLAAAGVGILGGAVLSWLTLAAFVTLLRADVRTSMIGAAALAGTLYYWFTPVTAVSALGLDTALTWPLRAAGIGLVLVWLVLATRARSTEPAFLRSPQF